MKAYEYIGRISEDGKIELPQDSLRYLRRGQRIRVLILVEDSQPEPTDPLPEGTPYDGI